MPPDPEKPIENLLRRYARKRRERAGEAWTVHPVTRRLWQEEVARRFPKKRTFGSWVQEFFRSGWLKPVMAVAGAAVIVVGLILSVRPVGRTDKSITGLAPTDSAKLIAKDQPVSQLAAASGTDGSRQFLVASDNALSPSRDRALREAPPAALAKGTGTGPAQEKQEAAPAPPPASTLAENKKDQEASAPEADSAPPIAQDVIAPASSTPAAGVARSLAVSPQDAAKVNQSPQSGTQTELNSVASFARAESGVALGKTASETATGVMQYGLFTASQTPVVSPGQQQEALTRGTQFRSVLGAQPQAAKVQRVLTSFNLEQAGRELRVIDSDGSVYAGPVQPTNTLVGVFSTERHGLQDQTVSKKGFQSGVAVQDSEAPAMGSSFQLTGTNKTLNRRVVFAGVLTTNQAFDAGRVLVQEANGAGGSGSRVQTNQNGQDLHLSGTAQIEGEPPVRIEASPASK